MSMDMLFDIIHSPDLGKWTEANKNAYDGLFSTTGGRYPDRGKKLFTVRAPTMTDSESSVPFAAYIHPSNPSSGAYGGFSFVLFPPKEGPCLVGLGVGTNGLSPDEAVLGRPGHARKCQAICAWLNSQFGRGKLIAWAKHDPTRIDIDVPDDVKSTWSEYENALQKYGKVMYAIFRPTENRADNLAAVTALLDVVFSERGIQPLAAYQAESERIQSAWLSHLMPQIDRARVRDLLRRQRFVIIQGPPGTGKTRMAGELRSVEYNGRGESVQFHPNTSYESFIGGLAPVQANDQLGLRFTPRAGCLMDAAAHALETTSDYLLHIDEINRADLSKVLGEAIFLLEAKSDQERTITLQYDFGKPFNRAFSLPKNLHVLGTMNSADRSIAIVDVAIRRRFAFVSLWPQMSVVSEHGCQLMQDAFRRLINIFLEHASEDAFNLVPGHSYFLEQEETDAREALKTRLAPLLDEYISQGYVSGFAEPIRSYIQWVRSL